MRQATLHYSPELLRQAVRGFWWRVLGWPFVAAMALLTLGVVLLWLGGDRSWLLGVLAVVWGLGVLFPVALYAVHHRSRFQVLARMGRPQAQLTVDPERLMFVTDTSSVALPWSAVQALWRFETCWLLLLSPSQYVTLPLADLDPAMAAFVESRVRDAGGKLR
jgi:hypothetical protein